MTGYHRWAWLEGLAGPGRDAPGLVARNASHCGSKVMDSKEKKRLEVLQKRLAKLRLLYTGAMQQNDDPAELARVRLEVEEVEAEIRKLKNS